MANDALTMAKCRGVRIPIPYPTDTLSIPTFWPWTKVNGVRRISPARSGFTRSKNRPTASSGSPGPRRFSCLSRSTMYRRVSLEQMPEMKPGQHRAAGRACHNQRRGGSWAVSDRRRTVAGSDGTSAVQFGKYLLFGLEEGLWPSGFCWCGDHAVQHPGMRNAREVAEVQRKVGRMKWAGGLETRLCPKRRPGRTARQVGGQFGG